MKIKITHIPTGESVIHQDDGEYDRWLWGTDGSFRYDCNRFLYFERAKGNDPKFEDCPPCGDGVLYTAELLR